MRKIIIGLLLIAVLYVGLSLWQTPTGSVSAASILKSVETLPGTIGQDVHQHSIEGKPSLTAAFIDQVLVAANSKAAGTGQALYDLGVTYGIDDAVALAFFEHESVYGTTGVARSTLSLGNIRCSPGYQCLEGYRAYGNWQAGYADWYQLIRNLYIGQWGLTTVEQIVPRYAPVSDGNDVAGYIAAVLKDVSAYQAGQV